MNTFLPLPDYYASAALLDRQRLNAQRREAWQIYRAITDPTYGWQHHPAVTMWRHNVGALVEYGMAACDAWTDRGYKDSVKSRYPIGLDTTPPSWLGGPIHVTHQSNLLRKAHSMTDAQARRAGMTRDHYDRHFPGVPDDLPYIWPS